jgi:hypothetical protein
MTGAVLDRPGALFADGPATESAAASPGRGGGVTLDELLNATLHAARTNGSAECPVCHGRMTSTRAGARASAACGDCGSGLS